MKILVTGGIGFIGSHLCSTLLGDGHDVIAIDNINNYYNKKIKYNNLSLLERCSNFKFYEVDIIDSEKLKNVFDKEKLEVVIHLAARAGVMWSLENPKEVTQSNIVGLINLLELVRTYGIKRFVFGSSSSVYGNQNKVPFKEDDAVDKPISPYAATKKSGEVICHVYSYVYGISVTCLRFFTVYGPRGRPDMAPYKFIKSIMEEKPIDVYGKGHTSRDYTYVSDIVAGIVAAINSDYEYEIINLGGSNPIKLKEFIEIIESVTGKTALINYKPLQVGDVEKTYADVTKAKELLNWTPKVTIEEGIKKTYEWMLNEFK